MTEALLAPPLARWDGLHLALDLERTERLLNQALAGKEQVRDLRLRGADDALEAEATVMWKGVAGRVGLQLAEIRLRNRHLGFRMRRLRALGGVPVPRAAVELALKSLDSPLLTVFSGQGIVVTDLRRWLPAEAEVSVLTLQATQRTIHVWFGPGRLTELPGQGPGLLPA